MSTCSALRYTYVLELFYFAFILPIIIANPVPSIETLYDASVQSLLNNKCEMPKEIQFPFSKISDPSKFDYLKVPLKECETAESLGENQESNLLCKEIFEVLKNITCSKYNGTLPEIKSLPKTDDVCSEFKAAENIIPKQNKYLSGRLEDKLICNILCQDKFKILCQTLLWSYNVQYQLKNFLSTEVAEDKNDKTITNKVSDTQKIAQEPVLDTSDNPSKAVHFVTDSQAVNAGVNEQAKNTNDLNANNVESPLQIVNSFDNPTASNQLETVAASENLGDNNKNSEVISSTQNGNLQESKVSGSDVQVGESTNVENNQVIPKNKEPLSNDLPDVKNDDKISKNLTSQIPTQGIHGKEVHSNTLQDQNKSKPNTPKHNVETNSNPKIPTISNIVEENEFKNEGGEENESKVHDKSSDSEKPLTNNTKKLTDTKETNSAIPSKIASDTESSTLQISSDINPNAEQDEEQDEKDADQYYNDTENEGDYSKSEYEIPSNENLKVKKPEVKGSVISEVVKPNEPSSYEFVDRNIGRGRDEMQMVATFPEQEDGHFFFYFLSIVLILMAGYLIFHNKQKIIALIVEGRHERRRRSHGAGYKKLETK